MIDINQWRVSIGLWYCHQIPYTTKKGITSDILGCVESLLLSGGSGDEGGGNLISLVLFCLLLILSGDIELNPGPKTGKQQLKLLHHSKSNWINIIQVIILHAVSSLS